MTVSPFVTRPASDGRLIAVASGKGGVGKTWFAITLAHAMARAGQRVLLFDGDLGLANIDIQLGLMPERDLSAVLNGNASVIDVVFSYAPGGFDVLPGRSGSGALSTINPQTLEQILNELRAAAMRSYDVVVLDLAAGLDRAVRRMAVAADTLLVVVTDEPTSLTDAYAVLKLYAKDRLSFGKTGDARVVVNLAPNHTGGERTFAALSRATTAFLGQTPKLAGIIRRDEKVPEAIRRQSLMLTRHPTSAAARDVEQLARSL